MNQFRKISAYDEDYKIIKNLHYDEYVRVKEFGELQSRKDGKVTKRSGRGESYAAYLIRLVILYEENFNDNIKTLGEFEGLVKIRKLEQSPEFSSYNESEGRFPKSAISNYAAYLTYKIEIVEEGIGRISSFEQSKITDHQGLIREEELIRKAQKKRKKLKLNSDSTYPRNINESNFAKKRANYLCELNPSHVTFKTTVDGVAYIEAHHLVPMATQDYFVNTIDFADNIIALCPNCHKEVHHGMKERRKEIIKKLFEERKVNYEKYGIEISMDLLLDFYGIN